MEDVKQHKCTRIERERERHKEYIFISKKATITNEQQQPSQKVTKSLDIVTHLGQLPFILFTQMARTWATNEDSVEYDHYTLVFDTPP